MEKGEETILLKGLTSWFELLRYQSPVSFNIWLIRTLCALETFYLEKNTLSLFFELLFK